MALKLGMNKAYNRNEWGFFEQVMERMGFQARWTDLIMLCVKFHTFSIRINGESKGSLKPTRGLRQGDPPFSYLFLLCIEGLVAFLKKVDMVLRSSVKSLAMICGVRDASRSATPQYYCLI